MDAVSFAEEFFDGRVERVLGGGREGGEGELRGVQGAVERGNVVGLWEGLLFGEVLVRPEGGGGDGLRDAGGC